MHASSITARGDFHLQAEPLGIRAAASLQKACSRALCSPPRRRPDATGRHQVLKRVTLRELAAGPEGEALAGQLISALISDHLAAPGSVTDDLAAQLQGGAPAFFKVPPHLIFWHRICFRRAVAYLVPERYCSAMTTSEQWPTVNSVRTCFPLSPGMLSAALRHNVASARTLLRYMR